jgi:hypothetical protein
MLGGENSNVLTIYDKKRCRIGIDEEIPQYCGEYYTLRSKSKLLYYLYYFNKVTTECYNRMIQPNVTTECYNQMLKSLQPNAKIITIRINSKMLRHKMYQKGIITTTYELKDS